MPVKIAAMSNIPSQSLEGHNAIVTGAAQGFGLAIAKQLASQGARILIWDMDEQMMEQAASELADSTLRYPVDVSDWAKVQAAAQASCKDAGQIHVLVNNAGISGSIAPVIDYDVDEWQKVLAVDLNSVFYCAKALLGHMRDAGYGRMINIASIAGKEGNPKAAAYSAAKAGVIALTKSLGKEHADCDIAINCVTPAAARTRIFEQITEEHINYMLSKIPRNRFVLVEELASLVGWLASPANSYATGAAFDMSGGRATY